MSGLEASSPPSPPPAPPSLSAMTVDLSSLGLAPFGDPHQGLYLFPEAPFSLKGGDGVHRGSSSSPHRHRVYDHAGDTMLSAINYGEDEVLQEGFEVPFGSLDGLLPPRPATAPADPSPFDLLGDAELQLSPQSFGADTVGPLTAHTGSTVVSGHEPGVPISCAGLIPKEELERASPIVVAPPAAPRSVVKAGGNGRAPSAQPCPICGKVFGNSSALTKHKLTHSDERKYVCQQCNKAFKRQDHLNGHLLTHRNKKPYQCDVEGCDKSYCDARSLRRHKENHHASLALTLLPFQAIPLPPQLQLVAFPATSEDGTTPLWAPRPPLLVTTEAGPRGLRTSPSPRQDQKGAPLLQQLLDSSKSWTMHTNNRGSPQVSYSADVSINTDSLPTGDLDSALDATPLECPLCQLKFNSVADLDAHERLHQVHSDTGDLFQEVLQKHEVDEPREPQQPMEESVEEPAVQTLSSAAEDTESQLCSLREEEALERRSLLPPLSAWASRLPRSANGAERRRHSDSDHLAFEGSGLLADLLLGPRRTARVGSDPGLEPLPSFAHLQGLGRNSLGSSPDAITYEHPQEEEEPFPELEGDPFEDRHEEQHMETTTPPPDCPDNAQTNADSAAYCSRVLDCQREQAESPARVPTPSEEGVAQPEVTTPRVPEYGDDDVFLSPIPTSPLRSRRKHRPEPLYIPPHVNAIGFPSRLRSPRLWDPCSEISCKGLSGGSTSPPPYTPPPMLSPLRSGSGLFWHVLSGPRSAGPTTPHTAATPRDRISGGHIQCTTGGMPPSPIEEMEENLPSEEDDELAPETDILPHVNVGPQYQARLPPLDVKQALEADHNADLVWDPHTCDQLCEDEVDAYLELASCAAVPGGGRNREYAFHVLALCQGNLQEATLQLMDRNPMLPGDHPLLTYRYSECHRWNRDEVERFQEGLAAFDKDFLHVSAKVGTKSVQQCVEFYYVWKKVAPEEYRRLRCLRRRRELDAAAPDDEENDRTVVYGAPSPPTLPPGPPDPPPQQCEPPQEFPCRLCGRVFAKVKSRNAHMKSHGAPRAVGSSRFEF